MAKATATILSYPAADKTKLAGVAEGAEANIGEEFTPGEQTKLAGLNFQHGVIAGVSQSWNAISFGTPFDSVPNVFFAFEVEASGNPADFQGCYYRNLTVSGVEVWYKEIDGEALNIRWLASDVGNS